MSRILGKYGCVRWRTPVLALLLFALTSAASVQAMWVRLTDAELVENTQLIVMATYIGRTEVNLEMGGRVIYLGVLDVDDTLKGNRQEVVLIKLNRPEGIPYKSDDIFFRPGQKGLWFLRKHSQQTGIYLIDNPQRFVPEKKLDSRIDSLLKLLAY